MFKLRRGSFVSRLIRKQAHRVSVEGKIVRDCEQSGFVPREM